MSEWSASNEATRVWAIFSGMYGARLTRDFGESVPEVWKQSISGMKRHEIERGLRRLTVGGSGSPPTLPQFVKACRTIGDDEGSARHSNTFELPEKDLRDTFDCFADHLFYNYLHRKKGVDKDLLPKLLEVKKRITNDMREIHKEDHVTATEFRDAFNSQLDLVA